MCVNSPRPGRVRVLGGMVQQFVIKGLWVNSSGSKGFGSTVQGPRGVAQRFRVQEVWQEQYRAHRVWFSISGSRSMVKKFKVQGFGSTV